MTTIKFDPKRDRYDRETQTFTVSERWVRFDTSYLVFSPKTGASRRFDFVRSTGSEWNPNTRWVYQSECGLTLEVTGDPDIREAAQAFYAKKKFGSDFLA